MHEVSAREMVYLPSNVAKPSIRDITFAPGAASTGIRGDKLTPPTASASSFQAGVDHSARRTLADGAVATMAS
jgi:hypothetical protein